jgi:putative tryptophan/tyrosine transport system substrate-binding protein
MTLLSLVGWRHAVAQVKVFRLGFLWTSNPEAEYLEAFRLGLRELGYTEGRNVVLEQRSAANVVSRLDALAGELIAQKVEVVVTQGSPAARALARASDTLPIVLALGEPLGARLVTSLGHPGGNVTGLTVLAAELSAKRLELLKQVNPKLARVAVLVDATTTDPDGAPIVGPRALEAAARSLGVQVQVLLVRGPQDFAAAYAAASEARADALILSPSPVLSFHNKPLVDLAAKHRLLAIYGNPESVKLGGLMSYGPSYTALFRRAATYVDKILKGARPGDLPIEQPTTFELAINLRTAKELGVAIPQALLLRADKVIE